MKKVSALNVARLRTEESFGYLKLVKAEIVNLPGQDEEGPVVESTRTASPALTNAIDGYTEAFDGFDNALKASDANPVTVFVTAADEARDDAWRGANSYVKAMCYYPVEEVAASAVEMKKVFEKYGDPTKLPQTEESGVLHNLLQDLEAFDSAKRTAITFDIWLDNLKEKEEAFLEVAMKRTEADASRQVGIVKETRAAAEEAYRKLVDTVNALAMIEGDAEYAVFIDRLNAMVDRQRSISKARASRAQKDDKPVVE